ncbi:unnamed protein product [Clavelina lepadiformis]|uniref:Uncharacterized protein n=1 Tax=Clavelina lepadiformis TaxID=159417 RepID=A0ABP0FTE6_CLALP
MRFESRSLATPDIESVYQRTLDLHSCHKLIVNHDLFSSQNALSCDQPETMMRSSERLIQKRKPGRMKIPKYRLNILATVNPQNLIPDTNYFIDHFASIKALLQIVCCVGRVTSAHDSLEKHRTRNKGERKCRNGDGLTTAEIFNKNLHQSRISAEHASVPDPVQYG